eukprot:gene11789-13682_t
MVIDSSFIPANLLLMYSVYLVGTASPGPSNMTIMAVAIQRGRTPALALASGVITGSIAWGLLAGFGLATALSTWGNILVALKVAGGLYLLWLAYSAGRSALKSNGKSKKYADSLAFEVAPKLVVTPFQRRPLQSVAVLLQESASGCN